MCIRDSFYTGDILNPKRAKYNIKYFVKLAKDLEEAGAHVLGIKDMAGLLKPAAAHTLIGALKKEIGLPIHFHTHDTSVRFLEPHVGSSFHVSCITGSTRRSR
mgnify:CR=1 FL=1